MSLNAKPAATREKLALTERQRILDALLVLETGNFTAIEVKPLKGRSGWRLRVGDYWVLFYSRSGK